MSTWLKRIVKARPGAQVAIVGDDLYENIQWGNEAQIDEATLIAQDDAIAADEAAIASAKAAALAELVEIRTDAFVQTFIAMTPQQVRDYVTANVTDLASARNLLSRLSVMMLILAKETYK